MRDPQLTEGQQEGETATNVWECMSDINGKFVVPANSLCGKWLNGSREQKGKEAMPHMWADISAWCQLSVE